MSKRDLKIGDIPHKPIHVPKPEIPTHLEPVDKEPLPEIKVSFWDKTKLFLSKAFTFAQDTVKAVNNFHSSIKWIVIALVLAIILVVLL